MMHDDFRSAWYWAAVAALVALIALLALTAIEHARAPLWWRVPGEAVAWREEEQ